MSNITVSILEVAGYEHAVRGARLSRKSRGNKEQDFKLALGLVKQSIADRNHSHDKFMRMIQIWMEIRAPRYWWQQFSTYRVGVEMQSESTMYGLKKGNLSVNDFAEDVMRYYFIDSLNSLIKKRANTSTIKAVLPEGFLQKRMVMISAAAIRNIYTQRKNHKLKEWQDFISQTTSQLQKINPQVMEFVHAFTAERRGKNANHLS